MGEKIRESSAEIAELYKTERELNELIKGIVKAIISTASINKMSRRVYKYLKDHFGECIFGLAVNNTVERKVEEVFFYENDGFQETEDIPYDEGERSKFLETIFSKKETIYLGTAREDFHLCDGEVPKAAYFSPLITGDEVIGVFTFQLSTRSEFTEEELRVCRELIPFLTISLNNSLQRKQLVEINHKLRILSQYDDLTGLHNRRSFYDNFSHEREKAIKEDKTQYLLLMDLDNFKGVNDNYGHDVGDKVLEKIAGILKKYFVSELMGRYGGDEFIGGVIGEDREEIRRKAEKIIDEVRGLKISSDENGKTVGISIGILKIEGTSPLRDYFNRVDKLMYKAKKDRKTGYCFG